MAPQRPTQRDAANAKKAERQAEMDRAIAEGRLVVRKMTDEEREESEARLAKASARRAKRPRTPPR
jgi:hypothetical protein